MNTTTRAVTNNEIIKIYRSLIRKARDDLKFSNYEYFRFRLNNAFKEPVSNSYEKFRKFQVTSKIIIIIKHFNDHFTKY
ncbi:hypothetical protein DICPUDRAFT_40660 [Dictyostelium purpureum]|uniref:LYR motif-containing protein 4 n=1 Tax=Dictyostelium purpureum TaxID=5786 RepID=F0ZYL2_DICPU|nr:uncharacterized protein DICPUDRAFT_40660 [Dictyostelium purpureum]EGC30973.1 hypothetical protein DICPUDRAFT_40660 [Dictyostelium purpureum]|eukprot:XP_003292500.1 hypothetical protein DICPUDRAFT_40660 [Dictyostelium purpureum]